MSFQGNLFGEPPILDPVRAREQRDDAVQRVDDHASPDFIAQAEAALYRVARVYQAFTTDHVWRELGEHAPTTHERRAMGPVMMRGKAAGWVAPTDVIEQSAMVSCHARPKRVWRSLVRS